MTSATAGRWTQTTTTGCGKARKTPRITDMAAIRIRTNPEISLLLLFISQGILFLEQRGDQNRRNVNDERSRREMDADDNDRMRQGAKNAPDHGHGRHPHPHQPRNFPASALHFVKYAISGKVISRKRYI